jgi:NTE family protein
MARKTIGLALSGGAARGFAHIGVIKALVEGGVPIDMIAGTSAGSIVGGAYASGMTVEEMIVMSNAVGWLHLGRPSLSGRAIFSNEPMGNFLASRFLATRFEDLKIPFSAIACDLETGGQVVLEKEGDMISAIRASCAVPGIFLPIVEKSGRTLIDGGAVKPLPCDVLRERGADIVIGVDIISCGSTKRSPPRTAFGVTVQAALMLLRTASIGQHSAADIVIEPQIAHLRPDEIGKRREFIDLGEAAARHRIDEIKALIS